MEQKNEISEVEATDILLEEAYVFSVRRRSILRYICKGRRFKISALTLESLYRIAREVNKLEFENKQGEGMMSIVSDNAVILSKILAISILGSKAVFLRNAREKCLAAYLAEHLTVKELEDVFEIIQKQCNVEGFINSIKLAVGLRISRPKIGIPIE